MAFILPSKTNRFIDPYADFEPTGIAEHKKALYNLLYDAYIRKRIANVLRHQARCKLCGMVVLIENVEGEGAGDISMLHSCQRRKKSHFLPP